MIDVAIIGDGYTAADLLRLMAGHEQLNPVFIASIDHVGRKIHEIYPHLRGFSDLLCEEEDLNKIKSCCQAVFLAIPHGFSVPIVRELSGAGIRCVDLAADFRLKDPTLYQEYYDLKHQAPELLPGAVYGLPEIYREQIRKADILANPGCFPTGAILPLAPLLAAGMVERDHIIIDAKTGVSGAGRGPSLINHFCEVNDGVRAYGVGTHRHGPEMEQELTFAAGDQVKVCFTPHLIPMSRGILTTIYARLAPGVDASGVRTVLEENYRQEPFIRILSPGVMPNSKWVYGSNYVDIGVFVDPVSSRVILISALDNLVKGASGQAIQNLNIMLGLEETRGLSTPGMFP